MLDSSPQRQRKNPGYMGFSQTSLAMVIPLFLSLAACGADAVDGSGLTTGLAADVAASDAGTTDAMRFGGADVAQAVDDAAAVQDSGQAARTGDAGGQADATDEDAGVTDSGQGAADAGDTSDAADTTPDTSPPYNKGFIGGKCAKDAACDYDFAKCLVAAPDGGMCSSECTKFCPDKAGFSTTFCVDAKHFPKSGGVSASGGVCTTRCDFGKSATGCRPGYKCVKLPRYKDPDTTHFSCVPGSGGFEPTWCQQELSKRGVGWSPATNPKAIPKGWKTPACDIPDAIYVNPTIKGITFRASSATGSAKPMFVSCGFALKMADMIDMLDGKNVTDIIHYGTYNCRVISGTDTLSQHGLANALDIAGFKFKTGLVHTLLNDWEKGVAQPKTAGGTFLKWFADTAHAKKIFNVILTPEFNSAHANHFHVDMTPGSYFLKDEAPSQQWCSLPTP